MAEEIVINAKLRRTGICGAAETLLVDAAHYAPLIDPRYWQSFARLQAASCVAASVHVLSMPG